MFKTNTVFSFLGLGLHEPFAGFINKILWFQFRGVFNLVISLKVIGPDLATSTSLSIGILIATKNQNRKLFTGLKEL